MGYFLFLPHFIYSLFTFLSQANSTNKITTIEYSEIKTFCAILKDFGDYIR